MCLPISGKVVQAWVLQLEHLSFFVVARREATLVDTYCRDVRQIAIIDIMLPNLVIEIADLTWAVSVELSMDICIIVNIVPLNLVIEIADLT